jgi:hypothetical protein
MTLAVDFEVRNSTGTFIEASRRGATKWYSYPPAVSCYDHLAVDVWRKPGNGNGSGV